MKGTVYLVGAGPGDPGLVSARARELLAAADIVVYDRLIPLSLLHEVPDGCELVDAGKTAGDHTLTQDEINNLLVREALRGRTVVRLKGGDPFLFGRGGEEADACRVARVPFEVVPGVTSAFAVPAFAGIPVTHRDVARHVTVVTASAGRDGQGDPDYEWLARSDGTVVFLMGLRRVGHVASHLIAAGAPGSRPVAVISQGTTSRQRTVVGTLATIASLVERAELASPAIIVVGEVVKLREQLDWFERRPLFGYTVTVTRARPQASELVTMLRELGADVVECPMIRLELLDPSPLDTAVASLASTDLVVFTSQNGASVFFERLRTAGLDARALAQVRFAAVGSSTMAVCADNGIVPDLVPPQGKRTAAGLLELLGDEPTFGSSVLVVRGEQADDRLVSGLRELGARVTDVVAYRTVIDVPPTATILAALKGDFVTFTSGSTVRNFARLVPDDMRPPPAITIGPVTTAAARAAGFEVVAEAPDPSVGSVAVTLLQHVQRAPAGDARTEAQV